MSNISTQSIANPVSSVLHAAEKRNGPCQTNGKYHITNCPGPNHKNGDTHPSLHFWETEDDNQRANVAFKCFSGNCTRAEILRGFGLPASLVPGIPSLDKPHKPVITIFDVAKHTMLDWKFLHNLGVGDETVIFHSKTGSRYKERGVLIPYYNADGTEYERHKIRLALAKSDESKNPRWKWTEGDAGPIAYGLQHLAKAVQRQFLVIVEGESDTWTLQAHGYPVLGIPGTSNVEKTLHADLFAGIPRIYVIQEKTDQAGINFPYDVQLRLRATGYTGEILRVPLRDVTGAKDPNELHKQLYAAMQEAKSIEPFKHAFQRALDSAKEMNFDTGKSSASEEVLSVSTCDEAVNTDFVLECLAQDEWGDSILFAKVFRGRVLYDWTANEWYLWKGDYWELDECARIKHYVSGYLASVYLKTGATLNAEVKGLDSNGGSEEEKERLATLKKQIQTLTARAFKLRGVGRNKNVLTFAASQPGMSIIGRQWDCDPWSLACMNGVVDLRTGQLRRGKPEDYIRSVCPTHWQGLQTPAPRFERFLQEIFEDRDTEKRSQLIDFLQRMTGYGITGDVSEHIFSMFFGENGRNGKDSFEHALSYALGRVSSAIDKDVLLEAGRQKTAGSASPHLMDLQGKRIAWANEPEKGARFNVGQVKELSGGGDIPARGLFEKKITKIKPSHLLILLTNHKPHADPNDAAFWSRLRFISFNMRFVPNPSEPNERPIDTNLWKSLEQESTGILAWLVRGCLAWQAQGLATPQFILDEGDAYREEEDIIKLFIDECCVIKAGARVKASALYAAYNTWTREGNMHPLNQTNFGIMLKKKKFEKMKDMYGVYYIGLGILSDEGHEQSMNSFEKPFMAPQSAPQADVISTTEQTYEQYEGFLHKVPETHSHEGWNSELYVKTIHTIHNQPPQSGLSPLAEPHEQSMNSSTKLCINFVDEDAKKPDQPTKVAPKPQPYREIF